jgi:XapX domain-containing protein
MVDFLIDTAGVVLAYLTAGVIGGPVGESLVALMTGALVGSVFALVGSTVPAPPNIPGVLGVVGITLGFMAVSHFKG